MRSKPRFLAILAMLFAIALVVVLLSTKQDRSGPVDMTQVELGGFDDARMILSIEGEHYMAEPSPTLQMCLFATCVRLPFPMITAVHRTGDFWFPYEVQLGDERVRVPRKRETRWWHRLLHPPQSLRADR